jgi:hypothetical protein
MRKDDVSHNLALKLTAGAREHSRRPAVRLGEQAIS